MAQSDIRRYDAAARSTDIFGRVLCSCRDQHFVVDGPVQNGCPGEAVTPAEIFLSGVAACGVELVTVIAKEKGFPIPGVRVEISGEMDRSNPARRDYTVFNTVRLRFGLSGVTKPQAEELVNAFKGR
ncbi:MAG TPA: OsmC family protein [Thermoanaerobaculia bacterium]|nr:OsmC family protein [Thermoanaerobaculia bacterium]